VLWDAESRKTANLSWRKIPENANVVGAGSRLDSHRVLLAGTFLVMPGSKDTVGKLEFRYVFGQKMQGSLVKRSFNDLSLSECPLSQ
jgi:hypothetical protein